MRSFGEEAKTEESARSGAWTIGRPGAERAQETRQPRKRPEGRLGQKPQEGYRRQAQCPAPAAWAPQEDLGGVIARIRARFGDYAIGLGDGGIRYRRGEFVPAREFSCPRRPPELLAH
jgi:hypothetical protein